MTHLYKATKSALTRKATAWCFSGPAVFIMVISLAKNPSPETAVTKYENHYKYNLDLVAKNFSYNSKFWLQEVKLQEVYKVYKLLT